MTKSKFEHILKFIYILNTQVAKRIQVVFFYYAIIDITVSAKDDFQAALRADKDFVLRIKENEESSIQITPAPVTISVQEEDAAIKVILPATEQQTSVKQQAPVIEPATTATPITLQPDPEKRESDQAIYERVKSILREHKQLEPKQVQDKIDNILTELNQLELKQKIIKNFLIKS